MSKAQIGNRESKKPKADKNRSKVNVSAYKAEQSQGKPGSSQFCEKDLTQGGLSRRERVGSLVPPKALEPPRRQFSVPRRILDIAMPQVRLE